AMKQKIEIKKSILGACFLWLTLASLVLAQVNAQDLINRACDQMIADVRTAAAAANDQAVASGKAGVGGGAVVTVAAVDPEPFSKCALFISIGLVAWLGYDSYDCWGDANNLTTQADRLATVNAALAIM